MLISGKEISDRLTQRGRLLRYDDHLALLLLIPTKQTLNKSLPEVLRLLLLRLNHDHLALLLLIPAK